MTTPVQWQALDWDGRRVAVEYRWLRPEDASAPLLVFLHEGLGSVSQWRDFPQRLCEALVCRGLVYSRPGYGQSTPAQSQASWGVDFLQRQACEVLPALLAALGVDAGRDRLSLLGHSDGASIALLYAALQAVQLHAVPLQAVVALAPHINVEPQCVASIAALREDYAVPQPLRQSLRERLAAHHRDVDTTFWGWSNTWLHPDFRQWNITAQHGTMACAVLAIQGVDDAYGSLEQVRGIARQVPRCEVLEMAQCGHSPQRDQPERLIAAITDFFQRQNEETKHERSNHAVA